MKVFVQSFIQVRFIKMLCNVICYIGEGATMAAEAACLGVSALYFVKVHKKVEFHKFN